MRYGLIVGLGLCRTLWWVIFLVSCEHIRFLSWILKALWFPGTCILLSYLFCTQAESNP